MKSNLSRYAERLECICEQAFSLADNDHQYSKYLYNVSLVYPRYSFTRSHFSPKVDVFHAKVDRPVIVNPAAVTNVPRVAVGGDTKNSGQFIRKQQKHCIYSI